MCCLLHKIHLHSINEKAVYYQIRTCIIKKQNSNVNQEKSQIVQLKVKRYKEIFYKLKCSVIKKESVQTFTLQGDS